MSTPTFVDRLTKASTGWLATRTTRRGFLARAAVVGSALATAPVGYILRPGTAYASVCGPASGCGDGYTAMCCTVNNGVNACPPGTFAGGWWKADGASLCGGGARYYIDCQGECTNCSSGCGPFCDSGCYNCSCHCASGTCDERLVCCNVFRYGQCHQEIGCSGPVMCRTISCRPPWLWEACTTASATDENTVDHSAPCLPGWDALEAHYYAIGGESSVLGASIYASYPVRGGSAQDFTGGKIYWSSTTNAWEVHGAILSRYLSLGGPDFVIWLPTTDETGTPDGIGRYNQFEYGSIYWTPSTGAWEVHGAIRDRWARLGWERSVVGYPLTNETGCPDGVGRYNHFQYGSIYWTPNTGAWEVHGYIYQHWAALGWERSVVGYPLTNETGCPDGVGRYNHFQYGSIYWTPNTGAHEVHGPIYNTWASLGYERSRLGYPVSDQYAVPGGYRSDFQHGYAYLNSATGQVTVTYT